MVDGSLRVLPLLPPLKLVAMILLKVALNTKKSNQINQWAKLRCHILGWSSSEIVSSDLALHSI
jgi:hypothetical protein